MIYGEALMMKKLLKKEGVRAETYFQERTEFPMGYGEEFWGVIISDGKLKGVRIPSETHFYDLYSLVKGKQDLTKYLEWYWGLNKRVPKKIP